MPGSRSLFGQTFLLTFLLSMKKPRRRRNTVRESTIVKIGAHGNVITVIDRERNSFAVSVLFVLLAAGTAWLAYSKSKGPGLLTLGLAFASVLLLLGLANVLVHRETVFDKPQQIVRAYKRWFYRSGTVTYRFNSFCGVLIRESITKTTRRTYTRYYVYLETRDGDHLLRVGWWPFRMGAEEVVAAIRQVTGWAVRYEHEAQEEGEADERKQVDAP